MLHGTLKTITAEPLAIRTTTATPIPSRRWAFAGLSLTLVLSSLGTSIANVGLPTLAQAFNATFQDVQWVVLAYLVAVTSAIVGVGRLGDLVGRRRLLLTGIALFTGASALCGWAHTLALLVAARALQGVGAAAMMAFALSFAGEIVPKERTGRAVGLLGTMSALGTALGPSLGGVLIAGSGWPLIFLINLPLGILAFFVIRHSLPPDRCGPHVVRPAFDGVGTLLLTLAVAAYAFAMTYNRSDPGPLNLALLAIAAGLIGLFVFAERRTVSPLICLERLRNPVLRTGLLANALVSTVMMTTLVVGPFYLSLALGLGPAMVGLVLSTGPLVAALAGVPAGWLADRLGDRRVAVLGLIGIGGGSGTLFLLPGMIGLANYLGALVTITVGYGLFQAGNHSAVLRDVPADQRGVVSGLLNLSRNLGLVTGASLMGAIYASASNATNLARTGAADAATGLKFTFAVATVLIVTALVVVLRARHEGSSRS